MSLDYDLFVINPENKNTTPEQFRDCVYDALNILKQAFEKEEKERKEMQNDKDK